MTAPTLSVIAAIGLAVLALYLFTRDWIRPESACLLVLLVMTGWLQFSPLTINGKDFGPPQLFAGFGSEALITICALMVVGAGLERTGATRPLAAFVARLWGIHPHAAFLLTLTAVAGLSMFLNNTPIVTMMLPLLVAVSMRVGLSPSRILMPVGFATIIGGMATTIGTSTNLLVVSIAAEAGLREFGMFDFAVPVLIVGGVGILYLWAVAPRLLPDRPLPIGDTSPRVFDAVLRIEREGYAAGRTLAEALARTRQRLRVRQIERHRGLLVAKLPSLVLEAGDRLHVRDSAENLKEFEGLLGARLFADPDLAHPVGPGHPLQARGQQVAEVVVTPNSPLYNRSLRFSRVFQAYNLHPLALHCPRLATDPIGESIFDVLLRPGDIVLIQGATEDLRRLRADGRMIVLDGQLDLPDTGRAPIAGAVLLLVVATAATGLLPISAAAVCGMTALLLAGCLQWHDVRAALDHRLILLVVTSLGLGQMLTGTGAAAWLAEAFVGLTDAWPIAVALAGFILIVALLTEVVTNNALAVLGTPIAIGVAQQLGAPAEPFVLGLMYGANMSYLTPIGYQTNLLVMSAGNYRFGDFFRVGLPLQILMWLGLSFALAVMYDL